MKLSVIGTGYLGAVHAAAMARLGHEVVGIDVDATRVATLNSGRAPFHEPGLSELLGEQIEAGRLRFTVDFAAAGDAEVHFLAVGTPQRPDGEGADLSHIEAAVTALAPYVTPGSLVVGKSTVPVGTAARLAGMLPRTQDRPVIAWNPEFLREGLAVHDTLEPDRVVYGLPLAADGELDTRAADVLDRVYASILERGMPRILTDLATAELVKVSANAFLATKISFINAVSEIADATGADITTLADAIGLDPRIGRRFLNAGIGFGGGCLPKDIRAFRTQAEEIGHGDSLAFLKEVDVINLRSRERAVDLVVDASGGDVAGRTIAVLGLAFKPDSDDVRDSPALDIASRLRDRGATVRATDPRAIETARRLRPDLHFAPTVADAVAGAEVVVLLTEWEEYRALTPGALAELTSARTIVDGRNVLDPGAWRAEGWTHRSLGRPARIRPGRVT